MPADVILQALIGGVEGFADSHGEILAGLPVDRDLRPRDTDIKSHPDPSPQRMLPGAVYPDATFLDAREEVSQLLCPFVDVLGEARREQMSLINQLESDGHRASDPRDDLSRARGLWLSMSHRILEKDGAIDPGEDGLRHGPGEMQRSF